ncbi:alpha/beta fold hydrolase [Microbacterium sp. zg.Y1084]|uniref:alpha/beta fold hydrolase n=1 Tax=Microbacterium sp. zg.Y1084 TaxID=2969667 RepID=UPI00214AE7AB|nr:alpha/beta hydrolase [Microbacterium sp. zg.Y1084]MCR2812133.1 alpha/beta hydrolase [Microbacterium sp. zg.Y1084]
MSVTALTVPRPPHVVRLGSGTPVVFVHGNGVDHRMMLALDAAFDESGLWERIYLDLPGFGATPALDAPGGLSQLADWLDEAVGGLLGSTPFAVVGASLGGLLARDLVARRPHQCLGMALLAPVVDSVRENRLVPPHAVLVEDAALVAGLSAADAEAYTELAVVQSRENWERFRRSVLPGLQSADVRAMARLAKDYALPALPDDHLAGFDRPVLMLTGRQDAVVGYEDQWALAQRFPRATYAVLDGAGHNLENDQPDLVQAHLARWAQQMTEYATADRAHRRSGARPEQS